MRGSRGAILERIDSAQEPGDATVNDTYLSDLAALIFSSAILIGYHIFLRLRVRRNPNYTIQAVLNRGRVAWVERMMKDKEGILAVQTLRNLIMGATFFATTAVALIVGTITLSSQADKLSQAWHAITSFGVMDARLWLLKLLVLLVDMLAAFVCFSQAIRLMAHVGIMISVPLTTVSPEVVSHMLIRAGWYHTRGMRCYYFAVPLLFWLFGATFLLLSSCGLVVALYYLDKSPA